MGISVGRFEFVGGEVAQVFTSTLTLIVKSDNSMKCDLFLKFRNSRFSILRGRAEKLDNNNRNKINSRHLEYKNYDFIS